MSLSTVALVLCTCPDDNTAETLARQVVERRLAACVNRVPGIDSVYRWNDKIETSKENLLIIKTTLALYSELEEFIILSHPYECPEIIQINIEKGYPDYLEWIIKNTRNF